MKAIVVYESHWGNTAAIARAIAEGIGPGATAMSTAEAVGAALEDVDLIVAGAPLWASRCPQRACSRALPPMPPATPSRRILAIRPCGRGLRRCPRGMVAQLPLRTAHLVVAWQRGQDDLA